MFGVMRLRHANFRILVAKFRKFQIILFESCNESVFYVFLSHLFLIISKTLNFFSFIILTQTSERYGIYNVPNLWYAINT